MGRDGSARPLTNDLSDYRALFLTADSKSFVTTQTLARNVWVAPKGETAHATQTTSGLGRYFDLTWAPDGKIVYASDASGSADIYEIAPSDSSVRQLTSGVKRNYAPAVSPTIASSYFTQIAPGSSKFGASIATAGPRRQNYHRQAGQSDRNESDAGNPTAPGVFTTGFHWIKEEWAS